MLTALHLGNFKAFADVQRKPIRPLTLIFGANSSGKSTLIHSLLLARHAIETGELDVHRTAIGGDSVDLGGFRQYVHRRDENARVEWGVDIETARLSGRLGELLVPVRTVTIRVRIGLGPTGKDNNQPRIESYAVEGDGHVLLSMSARRDGKLRLDRLDHEHPVFREVVKAILETSTTTEAVRPSDYEGLDKAIADIVPDIASPAPPFSPQKHSQGRGNGALGA